MREQALAEAELVAVADEERRARDGELRIGECAQVFFELAFHAAVEDARVRVGAEGTDEEVMACAMGAAELRGQQREIVIDDAEAILRAGHFDRGAERAEDVVDGEEIGVTVHLGEIEHVLVEFRMLHAGGAAHDRDDARGVVLGEQQLQQLAPDQAGGAEDKMRSMRHLFGMLPEDLAAHLRSHGISVRDAEARRLVAHGIAHGRDGHPAARPVPRAVEAGVDALIDRRRLEIVERATDPSDGFVKYLFRLHDGAFVEAVRIPLEAPGRFTVCLSSQAGCAMACDFCATGRLGLTRHLEPWEIVAQFIAVRDEAPGIVTGAVFQGQGEPLHNYASVMRAAEILAHPCGGRIGAKAITISTVGIVPAIRRLTNERRPYKLIVSLTSAIDERRRALVPAASAWPVRELADAVREYQQVHGGRVTIAWVVLGGINTGEDEVEALRELFDGVPVRLNLIDVNDARPDGYRRASAEELARFRDALRSLEVPVVRRYSGGAARHAACGMLAAVRN